MYKNTKKAKDKIKGKKYFFLGSEDMRMIEKLAWNTFKNTGNINTFLELKQVENLELNLNGEVNGNNKDEGNSISRK